MTGFAQQLRAVAHELTLNAADNDVDPAFALIDQLESAAIAVGKAWSGSSLGHQARVYYADFETPPPGAHFSQEWGFLGRFQGTTGDWREWPADAVTSVILERAGQPDLQGIDQRAASYRRLVERHQGQATSILAAAVRLYGDSELERMKDNALGVATPTKEQATTAQISSGPVMTRDTSALAQGFVAAPHQELLGLVAASKAPKEAASRLADICLLAADHIDRLELVGDIRPPSQTGAHIFIGHGRSGLWRELKDFVHDRLGLEWDEFNRVPVAGVTNIDRLGQMLDEAGAALLVLTAEDEHIDGATTARSNVIHEAGLFQGRLGFSKAIVLLEEGCDEFSNIAGLGQIRFPSGRISAAFEEVRRVMEREGFVDPLR